jgi:beta-barrel assembly-enhancing protease
MYQTKRTSLLTLIALIMTAALAVGDGTKITAPKNKYSPQDDIKLGQEAAAQVRKEMPLLPEDGDVDSYVERVGQTLAAAIPPEFAHPEFRYDFSVVNASDINAFALPGGPMFVNRGMIAAAHGEGEMAGVMAHEISHVALRHGTAQATKSQNPGLQLGALGGAILGSIIGGNVGEVVAQGSQLGLGAYLLKFSREYETQADILGAQIMARAGYDPMDLAKMFQTIEQQGGSGGPEWLSSHPNPGNRNARISEESKKLTIAPSGRNGQSAEFRQVQDALKKMPPAPTSAEIAKSGPSGSGNRYPEDARVGGNVQPPSDRYRNFETQLFKVSVPENWKQFPDKSSVTFAPEGAYGNQQGQSVFTHGAIVGVMDASSNDLAKVSDQYISGVLQGNAYLKAEGKYQQEGISGHRALRRRLSGTSPVTNRKEIVDVHTTFTNRGRFFVIVQVVPDNDQRQYQKAFDQMVRSATFAD